MTADLVVRPRMSRRGSIVFWGTTILLALAMGSGGIAEFIRYPANVEGMTLLGYPLYFMSILGFWKMAGAVAIVLPGFPRLKEWAYAGIFFNLTGAALSHAAIADWGAYYFHIWVNVLFAVLVVVSWALRPPSRMLGTVFPFRASAHHELVSGRR